MGLHGLTGRLKVECVGLAAGRSDVLDPLRPQKSAIASQQFQRRIRTFSGAETIMWQSSSAAGRVFEIDARIGAPRTMLGTKWLAGRREVSTQDADAQRQTHGQPTHP